ncbi:unnamed protein product [Peronospora destructor]|uniref:Ubiquitin-like domain-containing protein n=1 Tax=Peronospora destructor TaxID=86335 RepID=A0AAV0U3G7_9STRA|nr:unnamed protein product [Peronospora destructor]
METLLPSQKLAVRIVVRNVYTPAESLALSVDPQMLVGDLKCRLHTEFPSSPPVSSQKLIFGVSSTMDVRKDTSLEPKTSVRTQQSEVTEAQDSPRPRRSDNAPTVSDSESFNTEPPPTLTNQPPAMTQEQQNLFSQSVLLQQQAMVLQQIQYLQYLLLQQRHQHTTSSIEAQQQLVGAQFAPPYGNFYGMMQPQMFQARPQEAQAPLPARVHASASASAETPSGASTGPLNNCGNGTRSGLAAGLSNGTQDGVYAFYHWTGYAD